MSTPAPAAVSPPDGLHAALDGDLGAPALRRLAVHPWDNGLRELLPHSPQGTVDLLRSKYKPGRKLSAYYRHRSGPDDGGRHVAVTWTADRVTALVSPADPAMPQLSRLTDPQHLAATVAELTGRTAEPVAEVRTVRYRPGQRHVLYVAPAAGRAGIFVKTDRDDCGARAVPVAEAVGATLVERCVGVRLADPVGYSGDDRAALWRQSPGQPLSQQVRQHPAQAAKLLELLGRAVRVLHDSPAGQAASHDVDTEAAATMRAGEHIATLLPPAGRTYSALVAEVFAAIGRLPAEAPTFTHGDLKCDNVVARGDRLTILDLDRAASADPALDLGKLLADLRWWCSDAGQLRRLVAALRAGYGTADEARWARAGLLAALFQLKLAARRCAVHDVGWSSQVCAQIAGAAATLTVERSA